MRLSVGRKDNTDGATGCGPDGCPRSLVWDYDREEVLTDAAIHVAGLALAAIGIAILVSILWPLENNARSWGMGAYGIGLAAMLGLSAAYNLWPVGRTKWRLRRLDHSAIFVFVAATYTPLIGHLEPDSATTLTLAGLWVAALFGVLLKLCLPGRFDRLSIALCLLMGASGLLIYKPALAGLPGTSVWLVAAGSVTYASGIVFHLWESLRFQNAIWHGFVVAAAACHYGAVLCCALPPSA